MRGNVTFPEGRHRPQRHRHANAERALYQTLFGADKVGLSSAYACVVLVVVIALASVFTRYIGFIRSKQGKA